MGSQTSIAELAEMQKCKYCSYVGTVSEFTVRGRLIVRCEKCRKRRTQAREKHGTDHKAYMRAYNRRRLYGLTADKFNLMLKNQGYACAICNISFSDEIPFEVDHDHQTGTVRALLCHICNMRVRTVENLPLTHAKHIAYIESYSRPVVHNWKAELDLVILTW